LAPALQSSNANLSEILKEGERSSSSRRQRVRSLLVVSEVALTLVLLVGAGLLVKSFWRLMNVDPGFNPRNLLTMQPVAIIDEAFARQYFQNEDPIGKRLLLAVPGSTSHEIVGVVRHVEHFNLEGQAPVKSEVYFNFNQIPLQTLPQFVRRMNLLLRSSSDPLSLAAPVRGEIFTLNKDQSVFNVRTMGQMLSQSVAARRFSMVLLAVFAALALALAGIGIYGVMSYTVALRTREIGIRMALGAHRGDVLKLVAGEGLKLAVIGIATGLAGALALTRLLTTLLFGVAPTDALTYTAVSLTLIFVSLLACYVPARRATKVDPLVALRYE